MTASGVAGERLGHASDMYRRGGWPGESLVGLIDVFPARAARAVPGTPAQLRLARRAATAGRGPAGLDAQGPGVPHRSDLAVHLPGLSARPGPDLPLSERAVRGSAPHGVPQLPGM